MSREAEGAYRIERMTLLDLNDVAAIEQLSFTNPWQREAFEHELTRNEVSHPLVARSVSFGKPVAGYCICWVVADQMHIQNLAVHPAHRTRGLGRLLLTHALDLARRAGATSAFLEVRASNVAAQALYRALGFTVVTRRANYYSQPAEDALLLLKEPLASPP